MTTATGGADDDELYKTYRPTDFDEVLGQAEAVATLSNMCKGKKVPHALLFTGSSGCGKTTLARILRRKLGCSTHDYHEFNSSNFRGIDFVRDLQSKLSMAPIGGRCRIYYIDECHALTNDAQNAALKMLEDTPKHIYFMLATTNPTKLIKAIHTRCTEIKVKDMDATVLTALVVAVAKAEEIDVSSDVVEKIIENSEGSARKALVILNQIRGLDSEDAMLRGIENGEYRSEAIQIARALMAKDTNWGTMAKILKGCNLEDPEGIRYLVLGYATSILLNGRQDGRAADILFSFGKNFYDSKKAGLVLACYDTINGKK